MKRNAHDRGPGGVSANFNQCAGRIVCEHLPMMSRLVDRLAVIRSIVSMTNHNAAMFDGPIGRLPLLAETWSCWESTVPTIFPASDATMTYLAALGRIPINATTDLPLTNVALPHVMTTWWTWPARTPDSWVAAMIHCK